MTDKIKNYALIIISALLLLSIGGNIWQGKIRKEDARIAELKESQNQIEIAGHRALAKSLAARADRVDSLRVAEQALAKVSQNAAKREIEGYQKTITTLRPLVAARIDSVPVLKDFVAAQDSTIAGQDTLITALERAHSAEVTRFEEMRQLNRAETAEHVAITNGLQESLVFEQGESRKWEKKAKKKWGVGVQIGWGVQQHNSEVTTGPSLQFGVHYNLFKF